MPSLPNGLASYWGPLTFLASIIFQFCSFFFLQKSMYSHVRKIQFSLMLSTVIQIKIDLGGRELSSPFRSRIILRFSQRPRLQGKDFHKKKLIRNKNFKTGEIFGWKWRIVTEKMYVLKLVTIYNIYFFRIFYFRPSP